VARPLGTKGTDGSRAARKHTFLPFPLSHKTTAAHRLIKRVIEGVRALSLSLSLSSSPFRQVFHLPLAGEPNKCLPGVRNPAETGSPSGRSANSNYLLNHHLRRNYLPVCVSVSTGEGLTRLPRGGGGGGGGGGGDNCTTCVLIHREPPSTFLREQNL